MQLISNEILTAQLGGTVYTTVNPISQGTQLNYNGLELTGFTITGPNEITVDEVLEAGTGYYLVFDYLTPGGSTSATGVTAQDMRDLLERQQNDSLPDLTDATFLDFANWINEETYKYLYNIQTEDYVVEQTINVLDGTDTYSISTAMKNYNLIGTGLFEEGSDISLVQTGYNSKMKGFYKKGNNVVITPVPSTDATLTLRYIPKTTILTAMTDQTVIDAEFTEYLKDMLHVYFYEWSLDPREVSSRERVQGSLESFLDSITVEPQVYTV